MTRKILLCGLLVAGVSISAAGDDKHNHPVPAAPTNAGLEKMKTLVGTWVAADKDGKPTDEVVSIVKLTAGGERGSRNALSRSAPRDDLGLHSRRI